MGYLDHTKTYSKYTFSEICQRAGVTPPILKKYQSLLKLGDGERRGRCTYYNDHQLLVCKRVKALRRAEIEYDEIIELYETETKILDRCYFEPDTLEYCDDKGRYVEGGKKGDFEFYPMKFVLFDVANPPYHPKMLEDKSSKFVELHKKHRDMKARVLEKTQEVINCLKEMNSEITEKVT